MRFCETNRIGFWDIFDATASAFGSYDEGLKISDADV